MELVEPGFMRDSIGAICVNLAENSAGRLNHREDQRYFVCWRTRGVKTVWGTWIKE